MNRIYKELQCGCLEAEDAFIPKMTCAEHGYMVSVPPEQTVQIEVAWKM